MNHEDVQKLIKASSPTYRVKEVALVKTATKDTGKEHKQGILFTIKPYAGSAKPFVWPAQIDKPMIA